MGVHQDDLRKMHALASSKATGVYAYKGQYFYAVKNNSLVLIGERFDGQVYAVSGSFLIDRGTIEKSDLRRRMQNSI